MVSQPEHNRSKFVYLLIPVTVGIYALIGWLLWRGYLDSIDPADAELRSLPTLKEIRSGAGRQWQYLFRVDDLILATDINGKEDRVILDIKKVTNDVNSVHIVDQRISPDGRMLAVRYNNGVGPAGCSFSPIDKLMMFDLRDGTIESIPNSREGFKFDGAGNVYWLSPTVFVMEMVRCAGPEKKLAQISYFLYDLGDLASYQIIYSDLCNMRTTLKPDSLVFILANYCNQHPPNSTMPSIRTEVVSKSKKRGDLENGYGGFYDPDWDKYNIYMNDRLVGVIELDTDYPRWFWDEELQMVLFLDWDGLYQMDAHGGYRFWHALEYIGKVPAGIIPASDY